MTTRILLADDHRIVRAGLRALLEKQPGLEVVSEAQDGRSAVKAALDLAPDVVILDISMPDLNGIDAARQIATAQPNVKIIVLSMHSDKKFVPEAFKAGACGYLLKDCAVEELVNAVRTVLSGQPYLSPRIAGVMLGEFLQRFEPRDKSAFSVLSPREREVLQLLAEGKSTKDIAFKFRLSTKTVEAHRQRIMDKLNVRTIAELTKYAIREGLTSLES
jgi:DNA-binding NarL/FixJ family response regulator